jgi:ABC-type antimicrobial peptide transport system permease subunit
MFYLRYLGAELRRRPGRTALTALGLAVGVGLVVIVGALTSGLDDAQDEVLEPLTGVGTDMRVSRPLRLPGEEADGPGGGAFGALTPKEQRQLERENDVARLEPEDLGEPGEAFSEDRFVSADLSFPRAEVERTSRLDGVAGAAAGLTLQAVHVEGEVPAPGEQANPLAGGFDITSLNVTGVDVEHESLAAVTPAQITRGRYFSDSATEARDEAVIDIGYARQNGIELGETTEIAGKRFEVVGLSAAPLGGAASNAYVELGRLQAVSDRKGRANIMNVRADSTDSVDSVSRAIEDELAGAQVVTASELADRVGGSLVDAKNLSSKLGTALALVALIAAFSIATLLTLSSVQKRVRELGTLKALGWRRRLVVRQVSAESVIQGMLGGIAGALLGVGGAALVTALDLKLEASVPESDASGGPFGTGDVTTGATEVVLGAPVAVGPLLLAVALAVVGGLVAGGAGGLRAARLRPAEALRSTE